MSPKKTKIIQVIQRATKFSGVGLFDVGNNVGSWEGQTGYRGMIDVWKHKKTGDEVTVEPFEDCEGYDEVNVRNKKGDWDSIAIEKPDQALAKAHDFMLKNPRGWK